MLDEALGTEADFKALIADLHAAGIKVLLDVVSGPVRTIALDVRAWAS